jgi:hypothetical protein
MARKTPEPGGFGLLTHGPTAGEMAPQAGEGLRADKEQPGIAQNLGCLQAPLSVHSLCLKQPARMDARGLVFLLALLLWRLVARTLRGPVEPTGLP